MIRYSLDDFYQILNNSVVDELPEETISIINSLTSEVGAPEYIKTPQFRNKTIMQSNSIRRKKKNFQTNDEEWDSIRSFQTTEIKKGQGIEANLFTLRKYLNMITLNTYDKLKGEIIKEISDVKLNKTPNDLLFLSSEIFKIMSGNILYSDIYSKMYRDLIQEFDIFKEVLMENLSQFEEQFSNIKYFEPDEDYDSFCKNNKKNETLRALSSFYVNLMKENIIDKEYIEKAIFKLFEILNSMINLNTKKNELDELAELLYIIITNSYENIKEQDPDIAKNIYDNVDNITKLKVKDYTGLTNKCVFKNMDILDEIS